MWTKHASRVAAEKSFFGVLIHVSVTFSTIAQLDSERVAGEEFARYRNLGHKSIQEQLPRACSAQIPVLPLQRSQLI
jgi:hypothetical protein